MFSSAAFKDLHGGVGSGSSPGVVYSVFRAMVSENECGACRDAVLRLESVDWNRIVASLGMCFYVWLGSKIEKNLPKQIVKDSFRNWTFYNRLVPFDSEQKSNSIGAATVSRLSSAVTDTICK